jgi:thiamine monophosphate synthase
MHGRCSAPAALSATRRIRPTRLRARSRPALAGTKELEAVVGTAGAPVVAIGGVTPARVAEAAAAGAHGVAVVSGVWHTPDAAAALTTYLDALAAAYAAEREEDMEA